ncbi:MAG: hypothetical protein ISP86_04355, partial [Shewanellaceae bacterium]|nr:hypothetical protein [Shewanellaceae bacterium]
MRNKIYLYLSWVITFLFTPLLLAKENQQDWLTRSSKHFEIYYKAYQQTDAEELLLQAERIHATIAPLFKITPTVTPIVLRDTLDISNAFATPEGHPGGSKIEMFMTPPDNVKYELASLKDWRHDILLHEYTHILNFHALGAKVADWNIFLLEGFAVYMESKSDPTNGRLNSAYYRLIMRQEVVSEHFKSWEQISIINQDWPYNKHYVYGAFFTQYLIDTYGEPAYLKLLEEAREEGLDAAELKTVYHKDFFMLWQDFEQAMRKKFAPELAAHQNLRQTPNKSLLQDQLPPLAFTQQGQLYSSYTDDRANRRLATYNLNTDTWSVVDDFPNAESIDNHPTSGMLITTLIRNDIHSSHMVLKIYQNQQ